MWLVYEPLFAYSIGIILCYGYFYNMLKDWCSGPEGFIIFGLIIIMSLVWPITLIYIVCLIIKTKVKITIL